MNSFQISVLVAIITGLCVLLYISISRNRCRWCKTGCSMCSGNSKENYQRIRASTHNMPYPMYQSFINNEGSYKYMKQYDDGISDDPFRVFPPVNNYTSRLTSWVRSAST